MTYAERELQRVIPVRPAAGGKYEADDRRMKATFDIQATVIYVGYAPKGTATSAAEWTIRKIELDGDSLPTDATWTAERTAVWDDRATETYT